MNKLLAGAVAVALALLYAGAAIAQTTVPVVSHTVDFSPVLTPIVQALGIVASLTALPAMWYGVNWVRGKLGLQAIEKDNALRVAVDAGLQKSLGSGISKVQEAVAGLPMQVSTKNQVIAQAATYAKDTMGDTLRAAGLDDPNKLAAAIEARMGIMEMQASTGSSAPGVAGATSASSGTSVVAAAAAAPVVDPEAVKLPSRVKS